MLLNESLPMRHIATSKFRKPASGAPSYALIAIFIFGPSVGAWAASSTEATSVSDEEIKQFMTSPPPIHELIFQQKVPMDGGARPLDGTFALSTKYDYFQARRQAGDLLFRRLANATAATNYDFGGLLVSCLRHRHGLAEPGGRFTVWDDRDPSVGGKSVSVFYTEKLMLEPLRRVLNLGVMYAEAGSIRWAGQRFNAEADVDGQHVTIEGNLLGSTNGVPVGLRLSYGFPHQIYNYHVQYTYGEGAQKLPMLIRSYWLPADRPGTEIEVDEWRILKLEFGSTDLPKEEFDVAPFVTANHWTARVYTNNAFYDQSASGRLTLSYVLKEPGSRFWGTVLSRTTIYIAWACLNLGLAVVMLRAKKAECTSGNSAGS